MAKGTSNPIDSKPKLIAFLREAAEVEQQLMLQYLYAGFSIKKYPDATCTAAQVEMIRRWGSTVYMVARQEMEHLALVNGLLSALGADPWFARDNIPSQSHFYLGRHLAEERGADSGVVPCDIPFVFERFNLATIGRFVCAESPGYDTLVAAGDPIPRWCFGTPEHPCPRHAYPPSRTHATPDLLGDESIRPGTVQQLYDWIQEAFNTLPPEELFTGDPSRQVFVPVEYQINIFPIVDLASANTAISLIVEEGEGIDAPPGYLSHFRRFYDVHSELQAALAADPGFEPSMPALFNPSRDQITDPRALEVFELFNDAYATMVFVLTSLYRNFVPQESQAYPFLSAALQENAFGPMMTMLLRPLAEILVRTASGDGQHTAGPDFHLTAEDEALLRDADDPRLADIDFFLARFDSIVERLNALGVEALLASARAPEDRPYLDRQLRFVRESAMAMRNNLRRIYQIGQFSDFVVTS